MCELNYWLFKAVLPFRTRWTWLILCLLAGVRDSNALQLTETHAPDPVVVGGKLTFTFTLENDGATPAFGTLFTNPLPSSTVFISANVTNGGFALSNDVFSYTPDTLQPGEKAVLQFVLTPVTARSITNIGYWVGSNDEIVAAGSVINVTAVLAGPKMNVGRINHNSTRLVDGRVLITGGWSLDAENPYVDTETAEVYDPARDAFTRTGSMSAGRVTHTATLLNSGKVLVAGGKASGVATSSVDLFDPTNNVFIPTASLGVPRTSHSATLLPNGDVILAGGAGTNTLIERFVFTNSQGAVSATGNLFIPRSGHMAVLLPDGRILFAGGAGALQPFAEIFNPDTGSSVPVAPSGHGLAVVAVAQGKVLMHDWTVQPSVEAELYDIQSNSFVAITPPPDRHQSGNYLTLNTGEVLITGGLFSTAVDTFDPRSGTFTTSYPLASARLNHSAVQLVDGRILLTGGYDLVGISSGDNKSTELYAIRLDLDQDGMEDAWELANHFDPAKRTDAVEDADGDGHTNLQEYLAGTDPHDPNSVMRIETIQRDANTLRIRFTSVPGKLYRVERATDLLSGNWVVVADNIPGTGAAIEITDPLLSGAARQLYRVRLLL